MLIYKKMFAYVFLIFLTAIVIIYNNNIFMLFNPTNTILLTIIELLLHHYL